MEGKIRSWFKQNWIHVLAWTIFIFYETIVVGLIFGIYGHPLTYLLHYCINISFFYLNACAIFPGIQLKKNLLLVLLLILILDIAGFILINYAVDYLLVSERIIVQPGELKLDQDYALRVLYRCIYFLGFSTGYFFLTNFLRERKKTADLENQHLQSVIKNERLATELFKAENSFLKAQINPHFLFNTLDYIYHNVRADAQNAADAVIVLSQIMRYSIDATEDDGFVSLGDEIEQVENLLSLYQLRQPNSLRIELSIDKDVRKIRFIPLVLLTLMENIFKHGNLSLPDPEAFMSIYIKDDILSIQTGNFFNIRAKATGTTNGLKNTKVRLNHAFGNSISFEAGGDNQTYFSVDIRIPLATLEHIQN